VAASGCQPQVRLHNPARAAAFYQRYGFESFRDDPQGLFLAVTWP
jgi:hypothetical protein